MMYLSKLTLNPTNRGAFRLLRTPYHTHAAILRAFPLTDNNIPDRSGRVLFRVEPSLPSVGPFVTVLVQSLIPPNWDVLSQELGSSFRAEHRHIEPKFRTGQKLRFRLRANPTFRCFRKTEHRKKGQRYGIYGEDNLFNWLERKGQGSGMAKPGGFSIAKDELRIVDEGRWKAWRNVPPNEREPDYFESDTGEKKPKHNVQPLNIYTVLFEGYLSITEPDAFLETLKFGIGSAKGFGCGLLSLTRVS